MQEGPEVEVETDTTHRHYHPIPGAVPHGKVYRSREYPCLVAKRRHEAKLCVPRSAFIEPLGPQRQAFYEQKPLESLPWFCDAEPRCYAGESTKTWEFHCKPTEQEHLR